MNLAIWFELWNQSKKLRVAVDSKKGNNISPLSEILQVPGGFLSRLLSPLLKFTGRAYHLYPVGILFGLGFDTASEVALLAMSVSTASSLPWAGVLALPLLFASGMSLMDTLDGVFMQRAYRWALRSPGAQVKYNLTVTGLSVASALGIGVIEIVQSLAGSSSTKSSAVAWLANLDVSNLGFALVIVFAVVWLVASLTSRARVKREKAPERV
jgi:high-affinity nickel-transport protein